MKDVVLARALDDSTFNVLNSCIIFNQIDIINHVQHDATFLREVVGLYVDDDMLSGGGVKKDKREDRNQQKGWMWIRVLLVIPSRMGSQSTVS